MQLLQLLAAAAYWLLTTGRLLPAYWLLGGCCLLAAESWLPPACLLAAGYWLLPLLCCCYHCRCSAAATAAATLESFPRPVVVFVVVHNLSSLTRSPLLSAGVGGFGSVVAFSGFSGASPPLKSSKICCRADLAPQGVPRFYEPLLDVSWLWLDMAGLNTTWATQIATFCNKTTQNCDCLPCCNAMQCSSWPLMQFNCSKFQIGLLECFRL